MTVIALATFRTHKHQIAVEALRAALNTKLPGDMYMEKGSAIVVLKEDDWFRFNKLFEAFGLTVSRDITANRLIDLWFYLTGELGFNLQLHFRNESLYRSVKGRLPPLIMEYIDALIQGDIAHVRLLAEKLDIVASCPVLGSSGSCALYNRKTDR